MDRHKPKRVAPLWFRRWSRSGAAVFHSLHSVVLIGRLGMSVLRSLGHKRGNASSQMALQTERPWPRGMDKLTRPYPPDIDSRAEAWQRLILCQEHRVELLVLRLYGTPSLEDVPQLLV